MRFCQNEHFTVIRIQISFNMSIGHFFYFWVKNSIFFFANFKLKILKANFFRENKSLWNPLQETINFGGGFLHF